MEQGEGLSLFLEDIALITDSDREGSDDNMVSLMTVHLAKGLEFKNVVIAGAEDGLFPHSRTFLEPKELEEERRLMYVALTRAKSRLFITRAKERFKFGSYSANPRSKFLAEIPPELMEVKLSEPKYQFGGGSWGQYTRGGQGGGSGVRIVAAGSSTSSYKSYAQGYTSGHAPNQNGEITGAKRA